VSEAASVKAGVCDVGARVLISAAPLGCPSRYQIVAGGGRVAAEVPLVMSWKSAVYAAVSAPPDSFSA